jgi:hypothetical protein
MKYLIYLFIFVLLSSFTFALSITAPETIEVYAGDNFTINIGGNDYFTLNITEPCYSYIENGTAPMDIMVYVSDDASSNNQTCEISAEYWVEPTLTSYESGSGATTPSNSAKVRASKLPKTPKNETKIVDNPNKEENNKIINEQNKESTKDKSKIKEFFSPISIMFVSIMSIIILIAISLLYSLKE